MDGNVVEASWPTTLGMVAPSIQLPSPFVLDQVAGARLRDALQSLRFLQNPQLPGPNPGCHPSSAFTVRISEAGTRNTLPLGEQSGFADSLRSEQEDQMEPERSALQESAAKVLLHAAKADVRGGGGAQPHHDTQTAPSSSGHKHPRDPETSSEYRTSSQANQQTPPSFLQDCILWDSAAEMLPQGSIAAEGGVDTTNPTGGPATANTQVQQLLPLEVHASREVQQNSQWQPQELHWEVTLEGGETSSDELDQVVMARVKKLREPPPTAPTLQWVADQANQYNYKGSQVQWLKYGEKWIQPKKSGQPEGTRIRRLYYKCRHSHCAAKRVVEYVLLPGCTVMSCRYARFDFCLCEIDGDEQQQ